MGLVHDAEDDVLVAGELFEEESQHVRKISIGGSFLSDDLSVPSAIVVDVLRIVWDEEIVGAQRSAMPSGQQPLLALKLLEQSTYENSIGSRSDESLVSKVL